MMSNLQERYEAVVEQLGADSGLAKMVKRQLDGEATRQGQSAERIFMGGVGQKLQEMND